MRTPGDQQGAPPGPGSAAPLTATQRLRALYSQLDIDDDPAAAPPGEAASPRAGGLDGAALRRKHAAQAAAIEQLEGTQQDAQRRAALKLRTRTVVCASLP